MIIREAYRDRRLSICRRHYARPPSSAPILGPVVSTLDIEPCEFCQREVTDRDIQALRCEARLAGDAAQAILCRDALAGDVEAREECIRVIRFTREVRRG